VGTDMSFTINVDKLVFPVFARNKINSILRYLGSATMLSKNKKVIVFCKHVLQNICEHEELVLNVYGTQDLYVLSDVVFSKKFDFSAARIETSDEVKCDYNFIEKLNNPVPVMMNNDVVAMGIFAEEDNIKQVVIRPEVRKGYVPRCSPKEDMLIGARSTNVLSFPIPSGFSGGPIFLQNSFPLEVKGIMFNNIESKISIYSHEEVKSGNERCVETVVRVEELGLFHSVEDIKYFLSELNLI